MKIGQVCCCACVVLIAANLLVTKAANSQPDTMHPRTFGQHGFMLRDQYICLSWDVFQKFNKLLKNDTEAALVLADRDCQKVRDQTEVVVEDSNLRLFSWGTAAICVRPLGSPDCGWVLAGAATVERCVGRQANYEIWRAARPVADCAARAKP